MLGLPTLGDVRLSCSHHADLDVGQRFAQHSGALEAARFYPSQEYHPAHFRREYTTFIDNLLAVVLLEAASTFAIILGGMVSITILSVSFRRPSIVVTSS
jgi:hypothetical protein